MNKEVWRGLTEWERRRVERRAFECRLEPEFSTKQLRESCSVPTTLLALYVRNKIVMLVLFKN